jgi:hypothetical protein
MFDATGGIRWASGDRAELNDKRPLWRERRVEHNRRW